MKKIEKTSWFTESFAILESEGFSKITIDNLCKRLNVTKGSFYHHFKNPDTFLQALMDYWMEQNTLSIIRHTDAAQSQEEKKLLLHKLTINLSHQLELAIRAWGYSHPIIKTAVRETDKIRLAYLKALQQQNGMTSQAANDAAILEYAALIGIQQLLPDLPKEEFHRLQQVFITKF